MAPKKQKLKSNKKVENMRPDAEADSEACKPPNELVEQAEALETYTESQPTVTTTETVKDRKSGGPRSICAMYKVVVQKALGKKIKVTFDETGIPCGSERHTLQSYIGMLARTMVGIDIPNWTSVPKDLKQNLWLDVKDTFKVYPESERMVLKSASYKWRQFKSKLTKKYVLPCVGQKKKLARPPKQYSFVGKSKWKSFVKSRIAEEWKDINKKQSERVGKRKYPHRTSRKGYIGLKEEERKAGKLAEGEDIDRAILWKKARLRKDGKVDEDVEVINKRIDELLEAKEKGEFIPSGTEDVLTAALQTPEHSGRVRGVGTFITPTVYFNLPRERRVRITKAELLKRDQERSAEMEKTTQELKSEIAQLKALISSTVLSDKSSFNPGETKPADQASPSTAKNFPMDEKADCVVIPSPPPPESFKVPLKCELAVNNLANKVAFGVVFPEEGEWSRRLRGKEMPSGCLRVSVDGIIKGEAELPVPIPGVMYVVEEAVGAHVAWPKDLIIFPGTERREVLKKNRSDLINKRKTGHGPVKVNENVPKGFRLLYNHASTSMKTTGESIQLPCDVEVFGLEKTIFVLHENILALLEYTMLGQTAIATYILYLHTAFIRGSSELQETFAFFDLGTAYKHMDDLIAAVAERLREGNADRVFFLPYNHNAHWILSIIWDGDVYILNPLAHPLRFPDLEKGLVSGIKKFNAETGRGTRAPKVKNLAGSPKQPGGHECAYVVMRYMKEIIADTDSTFAVKWLSKSHAKFYTREELDEVRIEALDFIQDHI